MLVSLFWHIIRSGKSSRVISIIHYCFRNFSFAQKSLINSKFPFSKSKVKFNYGRDEVEGEEESSKKAAENSATQTAIQVLKSKGLWDIADL